MGIVVALVIAVVPDATVVLTDVIVEAGVFVVATGA